MKYRKKPVAIEAVQIKKGMLKDAPMWLQAAVTSGTVSISGINPVTRDEPIALIDTLEGTMTGNKGDWIIKGVAGELYPCKPDIFAATYEAIEETSL